MAKYPIIPGHRSKDTLKAEVYHKMILIPNFGELRIFIYLCIFIFAKQLAEQRGLACRAPTAIIALFPPSSGCIFFSSIWCVMDSIFSAKKEILPFDSKFLIINSD